MKPAFFLMSLITLFFSASIFASDMSPGVPQTPVYEWRGGHQRTFLEDGQLMISMQNDQGLFFSSSAKKLANAAMDTVDSAIEKICNGKLNPTKISFTVNIGVATLEVVSEKPCEKTN